MAGWTLPDKGEAANDVQSVLFQEYLEVLADGVDGRNCVLSGCAVTAQGTPDMTVAVAKGAVLSGGTLFAVTAGNVTISTADATNPRLDLIVVNSSGTKVARTGTAAAAPKPPARSADDVVIAVVYVPAGDTAIQSNQIVDMRALRTQGPIAIYRQTTVRTVNNTASAIELLNGGNGITIPNGLLLTGRKLRVHVGGNYLCNSGTPTVRIAILYGGTTMFSDISAASTADTDRTAFALDFQISAQANNDQTLTGNLSMGILAAKTAPTSGIGDAWSTASNVNAVSGSAAVDSDAADRVLSVQMTFSVAATANEVVVENATVEII